MKQSTEERLGNDTANGLDGPRNQRILAQRWVGASLVVITLTRLDQVTTVPPANYHNIIQAILPDRTVGRSANPYCHDDRAAVGGHACCGALSVPHSGFL